MQEITTTKQETAEILQHFSITRKYRTPNHQKLKIYFCKIYG